MNRRSFIQKAVAGAAVSAASLNTFANQSEIGKSQSGLPDSRKRSVPLAITMWEFSWLERRWPGAGYEDWDQALGELVERGYNAIRIDAFPHLIHNHPEAEYLLLPHWHTQTWGSPEINRVRVQPNLNQFLAKCAQYNVRVGLSTWFREDEHNLRMKLDTPEKLGDAWLKVIQSIDNAHLLDTVFYVDLCNEWTGPAWCPFFENDPADAIWTGWGTAKSRNWMQRAIDVIHQEYPELPCTFSFTGELSGKVVSMEPFGMLDLLESHIWMTNAYGGEFYNQVGYKFEQYEFTGYRQLALNGEKTYREREAYWQKGLVDQIGFAAEWSRKQALPLITTECWGVVDYRDWPLLDWGYVKELCALGTETAAATGRWLGIATSNFCGPQFVGMWRDIDWHRRLTDIIRQAPVDETLRNTKLGKRIKG